MMDLGGTGNKLLPEPMMGKYTDWCIPHPLWFNSHYTDQAMIGKETKYFSSYL